MYKFLFFEKGLCFVVANELNIKTEKSRKSELESRQKIKKI